MQPAGLFIIFLLPRASSFTTASHPRGITRPGRARWAIEPGAGAQENMMEQAAEKLRSQGMTDADIKNRLAGFALFDTNCDGVVDIEELKQGLKERFGTVATDKEVEAVIAEFDTTGSGGLTPIDFSFGQIKRRIETKQDESQLMVISSPMRWIGPYPALALSFPELGTPAQQARNASGIDLDMIVDTAANTNVINALVAKELGLEAIGDAPGGVGTGGAITGGTTFNLGTVEFADLPKAERQPFMGGLTASALPVTSPGAAGLLGSTFLLSFPGGFEMRWGDGADIGPSISLFGDTEGLENEVLAGLCEVPAEQLSESGLFSVKLRVNGVDIPALLDTGSPISVLNGAAAEAAGLEIPNAEVPEEPISIFNPFARFKANLKAAEAAAAEAASGDVVRIGSAGGNSVELRRALPTASIDLGEAKLGQGLRCYVGDLPGLQALGGLGDGAGPAAVLGLDLLRLRRRLVLSEGRIYV
mmetsp:Transcript_20047/g.27183  ORF Transcript_20047/g.27183 Transcript_20047/m.27183 type:complete len:475 (-) Transcript_20047:277-1701(-)